jgi:hypothetical protein
MNAEDYLAKLRRTSEYAFGFAEATIIMCTEILKTIKKNKNKFPNGAIVGDSNTELVLPRSEKIVGATESIPFSFNLKPPDNVDISNIIQALKKELE